jgi:hypothetical protein
MTQRGSKGNSRPARAERHAPGSLGASSIQRANEAAKSLPGTTRIVASSPWCGRGNTLSRRVLSLHSSNRNALLFSLQTVVLGEGSHSSDQVKTQRLLKVSLTKADFPDWVEEIFGGEWGASFDKFINRCFAHLKTKDIELDPLLFDLLTDYNALAFEPEDVLLEHTEWDDDADVYGTIFKVRYEFTVTFDGYSSNRFDDDCPDSHESGESGSLQDLLEGKGPSRLVKRFQSFYKRLPNRSTLKRQLLLEGASVRQVPCIEPWQPPPEEPTPPKAPPFNDFGDRWLSEVARSPDGQAILCRRQVWTGRWSLKLATETELYPESFVTGHTGCQKIVYHPKSKCWTGTATFGYGQPKKKWTIDVVKRSETLEEFIH